jgi:hypothetical protein
MNSNYTNHNRRILNAVAGEQQAKWERENRRHKLKQAKKRVMPTAGITLNSLGGLSAIASAFG